MAIKIDRTYGSKGLISFAEYLLMFFVIIDISCIWLRSGFGLDYINLFRGMVPFFTLLLIFLKCIIHHRNRVSKKILYNIPLFMVGILFSTVRTPSTISNAFFQILMPLLCFVVLGYVLNAEEINDILEKYINIMFIIALISLLFYIGGSTFHVISSTGHILYEWDNLKQATVYYYLYFEPTKQISDSFLIGISKNCGIFTEGTMYGYLLNMAFMFLMKVRPHDTKKKVVFILTILSTLSATPILSLLIYNSCLFIFKRFKNKQQETLRVITIPIFLIVGISIFLDIMIAKITTGSYSVRADHLHGCLQVFIETFPFGIGFGNQKLLLRYFDYKQGLSLGIAYFIALGGLGALMVLVIPTFHYILKTVRMRQWTDFAFALTFVWIFFCTNIVYNSMLQWFVLAVIFIRGEKFVDSDRYNPSARKN